MNGVVITDQNYNQVAGRVKSFYDRHPDVIEWHTFRGGMKKRISKKTKLSHDLNHRIVNRYPSVTAKFDKRGFLGIILNEDEEFMLLPGDVVRFCSNRITFRSSILLFERLGANYLYQSFQVT